MFDKTSNSPASTLRMTAIDVVPMRGDGITEGDTHLITAIDQEQDT